jgi:hypothetical protein
MTTPTRPNRPDITPPPGAEFVDDWQSDPSHRVIFGADRTVTDHTVRVYASAVQLADGSIDDDLIEGPCVYVQDGEHSGLERPNSDQARELAAALLETAAEIDGWSAGEQGGATRHHLEHRADVCHYGVFQNRAECSCTWIGRTRWSYTSALQDLRCHTAGRVTR